ncbi:MAG TPA: hypothetical protein VN181_02405, partial [Thermoanaerobaculia bacterium]|nr:hypothetical protein [Thermoanaerobaculia bacterium]
FFDLRLKYDAGDKRFDIHHGGIEGPSLADVLQQVRDFCNEGHRELFTLMFSHFEDFGDPASSTVYDQFTKEVNDAIGTWMYKSKPANTRLADITLDTYINNRTSILVVVDDSYPVDYPEAGFWVFRNSESCTAVEGELRVFDQFASDANYEDVKEDQLAKYTAYDGTCIPNDDCNPKPATCPCDLFLLSWTCTSPFGVGVWQASKNVNRHLGDFLSTLAIPNAHGRIPNILYVDYGEFARVTDVTLFANDAPFVTA